jgi:hypothetical protein
LKVFLGGDRFDEGFFSVWHMFIFVLIFVTPVTARQLKSLINSDTGKIIPNFRRKNLIAFGIFNIPLILWPVIIAGFLGFSILDHFAMMFITAGLMTMLIFRTKIEGFSIFFSLVPLLLFYEFLGFDSSIDFIGSFSEYTGFESNILLSVPLIAISAVLTLDFLFKYFRVSANDIMEFRLVSADPYVQSFDNANIMTLYIVERKLSNLFNRIKSGKIHIYNFVKLFQYSLFEPESTTIAGPFTAIILGLGFTAGIIINHTIAKTYDIQFYLAPVFFMFYQADAIMLGMEFLQHRTRLPSIWLKSNIKTRKEFTGITILTFIIVAAKRWLKMSMALLILMWMISALSVFSAVLLFLTGLFVYISLAALSLIFSEKVKSHNCWGWNFANVIMIWPVLGINILAGNAIYITDFSLIYVFVIACITGILLWNAFKKFEETEMDFTGPETSG